jgi:putative Holliday junction resolvase
MKVLALDVGCKTIGIAVSDATGKIAFGLKTLDRKNTESSINKIRNIVEEKEVDKIVVGLPFNMDASISHQAEDILDFVKKLKKRIKPDIITYDERLTSVQAEKMLIKAGISRKKRRKKIDKIAAQLILQNYLDNENN